MTSSRRELPADPAARSAALESVQGETLGVLALLDGAARMVPPGRPLSESERDILAPSVSAVLYTYGGNVDPAVGLALVLGMVALGRYQEFRASRTIGAPATSSPATSSPELAAVPG